MMNTYRFHAFPSAPYWSWNYHALRALSAESLAQVLAGVVVRKLVAAPKGGYEVDIQPARPNHHDALADIETALSELGLTTAQAMITEWVTSIVEAAVLGGVGGGAMGSATKDPFLTIGGVILGLVIGVAVGSAMLVVKAEYQADRIDPFGSGWRLSVVPRPHITFGQQPYFGSA
jgi:hypothetical protein